MAGVGLLALIDDIATLLDDVAVLTKAAAGKTAGVLGDDLALNAQQVSGVQANRELPVVWAVAKGSAVNKLILVPAAWLLSLVVPWSIGPLLMLGGAYLCFEGFEKIAHKWFHSAKEAAADQEHEQELEEALLDPAVDMVEFERDKIKGAIRTDFVLSAEIVVITLGTVQQQSIAMQFVILSVMALLMTIGVYGIVAGIVKLDDAGLALMRSEGAAWFARFKRRFGQLLLNACPPLMKLLAIVGTVAMFLVGGGIILHGIPAAHDLLHHLNALPGLQVMPGFLLSTLWNMLAGLTVGAVAVALLGVVQKLRPARREPVA